MTRSALFDFSTYITEHTRNFVGREWVFAEIDRWLADPEAPRYFIVTGEPGVGKTAIAARLTQIRDLTATHFCIARQADTIDPLNFARSLSHQLTRSDDFACCILEEQRIHVEVHVNVRENYGQIIGIQIENLIIEAPSVMVAFNRTVMDPLRKLYASGFDQQLVILVDALDEAVQQRGPETITDLLANARGLPPQIRFVLTSRPDSAALRHFEALNIPHLVLDAGREENLQDVQEYIRRQLEESEASEVLRAWLAEQEMQPQVFVDRITDASRGNFLYLVWLLSAIASGTQQFDSLAAAPQGLDGIYREFLRTRGVGLEMSKWRDFYRPLFGLLSAAQEALSAEQIARLSGLTVQKVKDFLDDIEQFLDSSRRAAGRYHLYHQSLVDFLGDQQRAGEFWVDVPATHQRIAAWYLQTYSNRWEQCDEYGLRYLLTHITRSNRPDSETTLGPSALLDTGFLKAKAGRLGYASALEDSRLIAQAFESDQGVSWDELVRAAEAYCELHEGLKEDSRSLSSLLENSSDQQLLDWIETEVDRRRKGILALGAAGRLTEQGRPEIARKLIEMALPIWQQEEYSTSQLCLAHALLGDQTVDLPKPKAPDPKPKTPALLHFPVRYVDCESTHPCGERVPISLFAAAFAANLQFLWFLICCFVVFIVWLGFAVNDSNRGPLGVLFIIICVLAFVAVPLIRKACGAYLKGHTACLKTVMHGLTRASESAAPTERVRVLKHALRFYSMLHDPLENLALSLPGNEAIADGMVRGIKCFDVPDQAAKWLIQLGLPHADDPFLAAWVVALIQIDLKPRAALLAALLEQVYPFPAGSAPEMEQTVASLFVSTFSQLRDSPLLEHVIYPLNACLGRFTYGGLFDQMVAQLRRAHPDLLGRALLLSSYPSSVWSKKDWSSRSGFMGIQLSLELKQIISELSDVLQNARDQLTNPLNGAELAFFTITLVPIAVVSAFFLVALCVVSILIFTIMFPCFLWVLTLFLQLRTYDPLRLRSLYKKTRDPAVFYPQAERLVQTQNPKYAHGSSKFIEGGFWRFLDTALAYQLTASTAQWEKVFQVYPLERIRRVLAHLVKNGCVEAGRKLILAVMGDQRMLSLVKAEGNKPARARCELDEGAQRTQLARVLPLHPAWQHLLVSMLLGWSGVLVWWGLISWLGPKELAPQMDIYLLLGAAGLCAVLTILRYLGFVGFLIMMIFCGISLLQSIVYPWVFFISGGANITYVEVNPPVWAAIWLIFPFMYSIWPRAVPLQIFFSRSLSAAAWLVWSLVNVLAGWLVPNFVAGWKGTRLLYPTRTQLLLERVKWVGLLSGGMMGLGLVLVLWSYGTTWLIVWLHLR